MAKRVAGVCYVKTDGKQLEISGGLECPTSDTTRESVKGVAGVAGYKETHRTPYVKVTAIFRDDFPLADLNKMVDGTVTAEYLSGAYLVGEPAAKADDGTIELEFEGTKGIWQ
jgi:hypothetical protein